MLARYGSGEIDATSNRVSCPQVQQRFVQPNMMNNFPRIREDEDCLYLNVFVPAVSLVSVTFLPFVLFLLKDNLVCVCLYILYIMFIV